MMLITAIFRTTPAPFVVTSRPDTIVKTPQENDDTQDENSLKMEATTYRPLQDTFDFKFTKYLLHRLNHPEVNPLGLLNDDDDDDDTEHTTVATTTTTAAPTTTPAPTTTTEAPLPSLSELKVLIARTKMAVEAAEDAVEAAEDLAEDEEEASLLMAKLKINLDLVHKLTQRTSGMIKDGKMDMKFISADGAGDSNTVVTVEAQAENASLDVSSSVVSEVMKMAEGGGAAVMEGVMEGAAATDGGQDGAAGAGGTMDGGADMAAGAMEGGGADMAAGAMEGGGADMAAAMEGADAAAGGDGANAGGGGSDELSKFVQF